MMKLAQSRLDAIIAALVAIPGLSTEDPAVKIALYTNNVTPDRSKVFADFNLATFTGSAPKAMALDVVAANYVDPLSGETVIEVKQPLGGLQFICTATPGSPEIIYGYIMTNAAGDAFWGGEKFANPITINAAGQGIDIPTVELRLTPAIFA